MKTNYVIIAILIIAIVFLYYKSKGLPKKKTGSQLEGVINKWEGNVRFINEVNKCKKRRKIEEKHYVISCEEEVAKKLAQLEKHKPVPFTSQIATEKYLNEIFN